MPSHPHLGLLPPPLRAANHIIEMRLPVVVGLCLWTTTAVAFAARSRWTAQLSAPKTQASFRPVLSPTKLRPEDVAQLPRPGTTTPASVRFSPDGEYLTYLLNQDPTQLARRLFAVHLATGETRELFSADNIREGSLSLEEKLRRERVREMNTGVTQYAWAKQKNIMLVPVGGDLWVLDGDPGEAEPRLLVKSSTCGLPEGAPILDARISADGSTVAFVCDNEVYAVATGSDASDPVQVTTGARGTALAHGTADFLAAEEMDRYDGFWLSPDGSMLAFEEVDESHIPAFTIVDQGNLEPQSSEQHRYPFAGRENPKVKLGLVSVTDPQKVLWLDLDKSFGADSYLARVHWLPDGSELIVQVMDRRQTTVDLLAFDPVTGTSRLVHRESARSDGWINLHDLFVPVDQGRKFIWASERSGYRHLYLGDMAGKEDMIQLTGPADVVAEEIVGVDEGQGFVYFMGGEEGRWMERHLFRASWRGTERRVECLTEGKAGWHSCVIDAEKGVMVDSFQSPAAPAVMTIGNLNEADVPGRLLHDAAQVDPRLDQFADELCVPDFVSFPSTDGEVELFGAIYKPDPEVFGPGPFPCVVSCYGGPGPMTVSQSWSMTADLRSQFLRSQGFLVLKVDNRGSSRRGHLFEIPIKGRFGEVEVQDQVAGVNYAVSQGLVDPTRVAISGWSFGGYLSLMCLACEPTVFQAAISGAPVTDWLEYDTCYTERYMQLPEENEVGYETSAVMPHVKDIHGSLLLCHGLLDENVLFRNSARLINELIAERKKYDLLLFPNERHGPRREGDRAFLEERILSFLQESLGVRQR